MLYRIAFNIRGGPDGARGLHLFLKSEGYKPVDVAKYLANRPRWARPPKELCVDGAVNHAELFNATGTYTNTESSWALGHFRNCVPGEDNEASMN